MQTQYQSQKELFLSQRKIQMWGLQFILNHLSVAWQQRRIGYQAVYNRFNILVNIYSLFDAEMRTEAKKRINVYPQDFRSVFVEEMSSLEPLPLLVHVSLYLNMECYYVLKVFLMP